MAITTQEQQNIIGLTVGLFNAAPGAQYLAELTEVYEANGNSLEALVNYILTTDAFNAQYAEAQSDEDVIAIAVETFGVEPGTEAFEEASAFFAAGIAAGRSAADLLIEAANYLNGDVDPQFADIAAQFQNKIAVATYFSVERADIEELDVAALKAVVADVTADEESVQAAIDAVVAEYGEATEEPVDPSDLTEALIALQDANEAKSAFLTEDALASELVLAQLGYETLEEALEDLEEGVLTEAEIETAIANALDSGEGEQGAEQVVATRLTDVNGAIGVAADALDTLDDTDFSFDSVLVTGAQIAAFTDSSRAVQDTLVAETQAALTEATEEVEAAVSEVTGLSGRIATLQTRKAELNSALTVEADADTALDEQVQALAGIEAFQFTTNDAGFVTSVQLLDSAAEDGAVVATYDVEEGTWTGTFQNSDSLTALAADFAAATNARVTSEGLFVTAVERVLAAEESTADAANQYETDTGEVVFDGEFATEAPLANALIALREAQEAVTDALENLTEARELVDTLVARDADIQTAEDAFEGFGLNLIETKDEDATSGNDLFLFEEGDDYSIANFGEQGQDHIFFGDTAYQLVQLQEGETIDNRVGSATELEVFWEQDGADLILYVENEAAAGTDLDASNITTITLLEFSAENVLDGQLNDGLLSTNTAPVEVA